MSLPHAPRPDSASMQPASPSPAPRRPWAAPRCRQVSLVGVTLAGGASSGDGIDVS